MRFRRDSPDCKNDNFQNCTDIAAYQCYNSTLAKNCCETCKRFADNIDVSDCTYGDKRPGCETLVDEGLRCYNETLKDECCLTCSNFETDISGCRYGDKLRDCRQSECNNYTLTGRQQCCLTCDDDDSDSNDSMTTTWSSGLSSDKDSEGNGWVAPLVAVLGIVLLLVILAAVFVFIRRRRLRKSKDSTENQDQNFKKYRSVSVSKRAPTVLPSRSVSVSKRAPMVLPRTPSTEKDWVRERSAEYAYINPDDVNDVTPQRQNQPNPDSPPEYLELENSPAYSYADSTDVDYLSLNPVKDTNLLGKEECKTDDRIIMNPGKISNQYGSFPSAPKCPTAPQDDVSNFQNVSYEKLNKTETSGEKGDNAV